MPKGGKREGAGRPQGALNKITEEARAQAEQLGCKPLDVMLSMIKSESRRNTCNHCKTCRKHTRDGSWRTLVL